MIFLDSDIEGRHFIVIGEGKPSYSVERWRIRSESSKTLGFCLLTKKPIRNTLDNIIRCEDCIHFKVQLRRSY